MISLPKIEVMKELSQYVAPHIVGNDLIKELFTIQMFSNPERGEKMHLLLLGGTGVAKSDIANFIKKIMLGRSSIIMKDATAVGVREKLIRSNGGIVFADEFDKYPKYLRVMFLEAMQNGTVTVDKFGEHYTYPANVNVSALCNPVTPELIKEIPLQAQLSFARDYFLIARFHFFVPIYSADSSLYPNIAERMILKEDEEKIINRLREIVITTKQNIPSVKVDTSIAREIGEYVRYLKDISVNNSVIITPRLIEGFINATKAKARMMLRDKAQLDDFTYFKELYERAIN